MGLSIGIVGLPNVGKSSTFNALTKTQNAQSANYPFCTIQPNRAMVEVPDERLERIVEISKSLKIIRSQIEFVDIAGLVKGASKGEGLGNQFLSHVRETDAILHLVRCFEDDQITHVEEGINPIRDAEIIDLELILADLISLEKKIEKLQKQIKSNKEAQILLDISKKLLLHLQQAKSVRTFDDKENEVFHQLNKELRFLSNKEIIFGANVDEAGLARGNSYVDQLKDYASHQNSEVITLCAKLEEEMTDMSEVEKKEFLKTLGCSNSGLDQVIQAGFFKLGLINYFTVGEKEAHSWTIKNGSLAPQAAGIIHKDFERGFIRVEAISFDDFIKYKGESGARENGAIRTEGKDYVVKDGDILHFRFNV